MKSKFYLVWRVTESATRHDDLESAKAEARSLASNNPAHTFVVLEAISATSGTIAVNEYSLLESK